MLKRGPGKKRGWSLSAAKDLVGVYAGDRWIVCVCKSTHRKRGRVTKKGEVTMPKACWDSAQGSTLAEKGRKQEGGEGWYSCDLLESN